MTPETLFKLVMDRKFDLVSVGWGALLFPNPETSFGSALADQTEQQQHHGFKDARVDELLTQYDKEFDQKKRAAHHPGSATASSPTRTSTCSDGTRRSSASPYWNKFGQPEGYLTRVGDYRDMPSLWWIDRAEGSGARSARWATTP